VGNDRDCEDEDLLNFFRRIFIIFEAEKSRWWFEIIILGGIKKDTNKRFINGRENVLQVLGDNIVH